MTPLFQAITSSLAPGIALSAVIFYNTSLQTRFIALTGRMRELNREARSLRGDDSAHARLESLRCQVTLMAQRTRLLRRAILTIYAAFLCLVLTILELLLLVMVDPPGLSVLATCTYGAAVVAMAIAAGVSWSENFLSQRTILEDVRSSFADVGALEADD
jgi:hypothetical protein